MKPPKYQYPSLEQRRAMRRARNLNGKWKPYFMGVLDQVEGLEHQRATLREQVTAEQTKYRWMEDNHFANMSLHLKIKQVEGVGFELYEDGVLVGILKGLDDDQ